MCACMLDVAWQMDRIAGMELPALIDDMSFDDYLADPAPTPSVTSGILRELLGSAPRTVWQRTPRLNPDAVVAERKMFDLGSAAHALFVGKGADLAIVDADSWRTNAAKAMRDDAYAAGRTPILAKDYDAVESMAEAAHAQFSQNPSVRKLLPHSQREVTIVWQELGVLHRCRPDMFLSTVAGGAPTIVHYKTTATLAPATLPRYAASMGWDVTAAHYAAGVQALTGVTPQQFFAVQENKPPYLGMVVELDEIFLACGALVRELAIGRWAKCLRDDAWPGYPTKTVKLECPPWHEASITVWKDAAIDEVNTGVKRYSLTPAATQEKRMSDEDHQVRG